jgi:N-acetylneuraminic acid mutarotase
VVPIVGERRAALILLLILCSLLVALPNIKTVRATKDFWTTRESMHQARSGLGVAVVNGKIYAIGGLIIGGVPIGTNEEYDPVTDTWTTKIASPTLLDAFGITIHNNMIYVIGGDFGPFGPHQNYTNLLYNPATDTWENGAELPTPRGRMDANVVGGKIYVIGGRNSDGVTNVTEVYDPATNTWTTKEPIPTPVSSYVSAVVDNKIYVIGGFVPATPPIIATTNLTQIYDPETDTWSYGAPIPTNVSLAAAAATTGVYAPKRIHVLSTDKHYVYDPEADTWATATAMPTPRSSFSIAVINDVLYAIGGVLGNNSKAATNEQYTPAGYIPEFPSWTPLLIMLLAVVAVALIYRRSLHKHDRGRRNQ